MAKPSISEQHVHADSSDSNPEPARIGRGSVHGLKAPHFAVTSHRGDSFDFAYGQTDLARLCKDRELETTEIHPANDFYGHATIFKRYVGWPDSYQLKGIVEHAPQYNETMWEYDRDQILPLVLTTNDQRAGVCRKLSLKKAQPIGFSGTYAARLVERDHALENSQSHRHGTLVFPCHSSHLCQAVYRHDHYAELLDRLPDRMKPVVICIYWKDFLDGSHLPYADRGMPVVTAGHMYDGDFLLRFHDLVRRFRFALSNELGTHVLLSVDAGCRFSFLESEPVTYRWDTPQNDGANAHFRDELFSRVNDRSKRLFSKLGGESTKEQSEFAAEILGTRFVLEPAHLRAVFRRAERLDWISFGRVGTGRFFGIRRPTYFQRTPQPLKTIRRAVRRRLKALLVGKKHDG